MATENNASAACRNFEQIGTLSTLCMPELQFQHANMHALIHAVFCLPKSARQMAWVWKSLKMGVPPAGSFLPPKATTSKKSHAATDMTHRVQVVPETINKLYVFSLSAILHIALLSGQLLRPNSVPVLN